MKKAILLAMMLAIELGTLSAQSQPEATVDARSLSPQEQVVLEHLRRDWLKDYRTTSMSLAAEITKTALSDEARLRLARFLEANRKSFPKVARHGVTTVTLTPAEKRLARALLLRERQEKRGARLQNMASNLQVSPSSLERPLTFLQNLGVVVSEGEGAERRYRVAEGFPRRASPRIDFFSHQVEVNGSDKFEVA